MVYKKGKIANEQRQTGDESCKSYKSYKSKSPTANRESKSMCLSSISMGFSVSFFILLFQPFLLLLLLFLLFLFPLFLGFPAPHRRSLNHAPAFMKDMRLQMRHMRHMRYMMHMRHEENEANGTKGGYG